ncbi:MAG: glycosyltransferase [Candidatus Nealsonbacteria bacterium]
MVKNIKKNKKDNKTICFIHYGIGWKDGINTVIRNLTEEIKHQKSNLNICFIGGKIKDFILSNACYKLIPELVPKKNNLTKESLEREAEIIAKKIAKAVEDAEVVIIENPFLGGYHLSAMLGFSIYAKKYKSSKTKLYFRIHDLYLDNSKYNKELKKFISPTKIKTIMESKGVKGFLVINKKLKKKLINLGVDQKKIIYSPNGINKKIFNKSIIKKEKDKIIKSLKISKKYKKDIKILLYPVRVVPRKNIEEAILLTSLIRQITKQNFVLVISGKIDKYDSLSKNYFKKLKKVVKVSKMPVLFLKNPLPLKREYNSRKKVKRFSISDLFETSEAILMTSLDEGFGYPYLECWFANKVIIGRRIDNVISDFEKKGLKFKWLYNDFLIKESISNLENPEKFKRIKKIIEILKNKELKKEILDLNKNIIKKQIHILKDKKEQKQIIKNNLKLAEKIYGISTITKKFLKEVNL